MLQEVPDFSSIRDEPNILNIRMGIFFDLVRHEYNVYVIHDLVEISSRFFKTEGEAVYALNNSRIIHRDGIWEIIS